MQDTNLLQLALGVAPPWRVTRSDFDAAARRLDIYLDFVAGSRFACPLCATTDCPVHDTETVTWRHLNFFQHQAYLHARVPACRASAARNAGSKPSPFRGHERTAVSPCCSRLWSCKWSPPCRSPPLAG